MLKLSNWFPLIVLFLLSVNLNVQAENCGAGKAGSEARVPVLVVTKTPEGFTPVKNVADSTKDLIKSLTKKKGLCLTDNHDEARVVLEVLGREKAQGTAHWAGTAGMLR